MFEPRTHARNRFGCRNVSGVAGPCFVPPLASLKQQAVNLRAWHAMVPSGRHNRLDFVLVDPLFQSRVAYSQLSRRFRDVKEFHELTLIKYGL
jgi:hypothetical protein